MSIYKYYEVSCDVCGKVINHYPYRPTRNDLKKDVGVMKYVNGKVKIICQDCLNKEEWYNRASVRNNASSYFLLLGCYEVILKVNKWSCYEIFCKIY